MRRTPNQRGAERGAGAGPGDATHSSLFKYFNMDHIN